MVLGGAEWDRKKFPESNLHMCGKNDTKIVVYNVGRYTKIGDQKRKIKDFSVENKTVNS